MVAPARLPLAGAGTPKLLQTPPDGRGGRRHEVDLWLQIVSDATGIEQHLPKRPSGAS
jgi:hypothetical protein